MNVTPQQIRRTNRLLSAGTWFLIGGVVFYSLLTTTPFVADHTARGWQKSAPLLGLMVDVAFVMALQADSVLAQLGVKGGRWPVAFRWFTGTASVFLNTWRSIALHDPVGVTVHLIAPALLLIVAEVSPVYRRRMATALATAETPAAVTRDTGDAPPATTAFQAAAPPSPVAPEVAPAPAPPTAPAPVAPLVICGSTLPVPALPPHPEVDTQEAGDDADAGDDAPLKSHRLSSDEAMIRIRAGWVAGESATDVAAAATRSRAYVYKVYSQLDTERPKPLPGQSEIPIGTAA